MMTKRIQSSLIEEIKKKIDLADYIGRYVRLNRYFKGLCPFHQEKEPSFSVHPKKQIWRCFGCGVGGDIFAFVQLIEKLSFPDAVKLLANEAGLSLPQSERFKSFINSRWERRKKLLKRLDSVRFFLKQAERSQIDKLRKERHALYKTKTIKKWDSRDYLKEQMIDYRFDLLDQRMKTILQGLDKEAERIKRNG